MNENLGKHLGQVEIADLIEESVANAALRRQQVVGDSLVDVTEEEAKNIEGGKLSVLGPIKFPCCPICPPILLGIILWPPVSKF